MGALSESSFVSLDKFELAWRWTRPTHAVLSADVLARIRPLTAEAAAAVNAEAVIRCRATPSADERVSAKAVDADAVRHRLAALPIPPSQTILISWAPHLAVRTEWSVFLAYWDDFCYPSSDDVSIWAPDATWTVCYDHEEFFEFRRGGELRRRSGEPSSRAV